MTDAERDRDGRGVPRRSGHPPKQAAILLIGITALVVVLALLSSTGRL